MPCAAPVMTATLPERLICFSLWLSSVALPDRHLHFHAVHFLPDHDLAAKTAVFAAMAGALEHAQLAGRRRLQPVLPGLGDVAVAGGAGADAAAHADDAGHQVQ